MSTEREQSLGEIESLEQRLSSVEVRQEELSHTDMEVTNRLLYLQKNTRENLQPLVKALDDKERAIALVLDQMREDQEQHEKLRMRRHQEHQRRVKEIQEKIQQESSRTRQTEERFSKKHTQLLSQLSELQQQVLEQQQEHRAELERVRTRERERLDRELERLVQQREREVEERMKQELLEVWSQELGLHLGCVDQVSSHLHQHRLMWNYISQMEKLHQEHQTHTAQRRAHHREATRQKDRLEESIRRSSRQISHLNRLRVRLTHRSETEQQETDQLRTRLKGEYAQTSKEVKKQKSERACLEAELKARRNTRKITEASFRTAVDVLERLIQAPQKSSPLVQQLSDLFFTNISDSEFSLYSVSQLRGPDTPEDNIREESARLTKTLTDPEFLLKCVRKNDLSSSPCTSWHRPPAPDQHPPAPTRSTRGSPNIWVP